MAINHLVDSKEQCYSNMVIGILMGVVALTYPSTVRVDDLICLGFLRYLCTSFIKVIIKIFLQVIFFQW